MLLTSTQHKVDKKQPYISFSFFYNVTADMALMSLRYFQVQLKFCVCLCLVTAGLQKPATLDQESHGQRRSPVSLHPVHLLGGGPRVYSQHKYVCGPQFYTSF